MKKIGLFFLFCCCLMPSFSQSGGWGMYIFGGIIHNHQRTARDGSCIQIGQTINNESWDLFYFYSLEGLEEGDWRYWDTRRSYPMSQRVTSLSFFSKYGVKNEANKDGTWNHFSLQLQNEPLKYHFKRLCKSSHCQQEGNNVNLFDEYYGFAEITYYPENIEIAYKGATGNILPYDEKTQIKAPEGYHPDVYYWEFSRNKGMSWDKIPDSLQNKPDLLLAAKDIYTESVAKSRMDLPDSETWIRMKYRTLEGFVYTNIIWLQERYASPRIVSVSTVPDSCYGDNKGKIGLRFDRDLRPGEEMEVYCNTTMQWFTYPSPVDSVVIPDLPPGVYEIQIAGSYLGKGTYSASPAHRAIVEIQSPLPLFFEMQDLGHISCLGGYDGSFRISAQGGTGNYDLYWKSKDQESDFQKVSFDPQKQDAYINDLFSGNYMVYVTDENGCYRKDAEGFPLTEEFVLSQPSRKVQIVDSLILNPWGYGRKDGSIELQVEGGTPLDSGSYQVIWKDMEGNELSANTDNQVSVDGIFHSTLFAVGQGVYTVEIRDAGYKDSCASCYSGCFARDTFFLTAPPELQASVSLIQEISCHGENNGALMVHAMGGIPQDGPLPYIYRWEKWTGSSYEFLGQSDHHVMDHLYAGYYRVLVSDHYQNVDTTALFYLSQPDDLWLAPVHDEIGCSDGLTGRVSVTVTGGTLPYQCVWDTGLTGDTLSNLPTGIYTVRVTDSKGCMKETTAVVSAPQQMQLSVETRQPTCFQSDDGSIDLLLSGGTPEYRCLWNTGDTTDAISRLSSGIYRVEVRDRNGCVLFREISLPDPEPLALEIGEDRTLCEGQSLTIKPATGDPQTQFYWQRNNNFYSNAEEVFVDEAGVYTLEITDSKLCRARDTISIKKSPAKVVSEFIVATEVFKNDTVILVNVGRPEPDSICWLTEQAGDIEVLQKDKHFAKLLFPENGSYTIGLRSFTAGCFEDSYKSLTVREPEAFGGEDVFHQPLIRRFAVYPNPNTGTFFADVELEEKSPVRLRLVHMATGETVHNIKMEGEDSYRIPYTLSIAPGVYILLLETVAGKIVSKVIIY